MQTANTANCTPDDILNIVCREYNVTVYGLKGRERSRLLSDARHVAMYLLSRKLCMTFASIGHLLNRTHADVSYGVSQVFFLSGHDKVMACHINNIINEIKSL